MKAYITISVGECGEDANPVMVSDDPGVIDAALTALLRRIDPEPTVARGESRGRAFEAAVSNARR